MAKKEDGIFREIRAHIEGRLDELQDAGETWVCSWITEWVLTLYADVLEDAPEEGARFWRHCGHHTLTGMVAAAIRRRTDPKGKVDESQLAFTGFPRVQAYYNVPRKVDGETERVGVPVLQMTRTERRSKVDELRAAGHSLLEHADQLELFFRQHDVGDRADRVSGPWEGGDE